MTTYWLVEKNRDGVTVWLSDDPCWTWVGTTALAKRFPTKSEALWAAQGTDAIATEHEDVPPPGQ